MGYFGNQQPQKTNLALNNHDEPKIFSYTTALSKRIGADHRHHF